jgi:hypothetical protein
MTKSFNGFYDGALSIFDGLAASILNFRGVAWSMGIGPGEQAAAQQAIDSVEKLCNVLAANIEHYKAPLTAAEKKKGYFSEQEAVLQDRLTWIIKRTPTFNASALKIKAENAYLIEINLGAILRMASLCNEIAAIRLDKAAAAARSSIDNRSLFKLSPQSKNAKDYAERLLLLSMLYLFGHEYAHIVGGHCYYFEKQSYHLSSLDRLTLELDADIVGGHAAGAWMVQNETILSFIGYPIPADQTTYQKSLIEDSVLGALIVYTLFERFSKESDLYLDAPTRLMSFVGGMARYIEESPELVKKPHIKIDSDLLSTAFLMSCQNHWIDFLKTISIGKSLRWETTEEQFVRLQEAHIRRSQLKDELHLLRPFGLSATKKTP